LFTAEADPVLKQPQRKLVLSQQFEGIFKQRSE